MFAEPLFWHGAANPSHVSTKLQPWLRIALIQLWLGVLHQLG